MTILGTPAISFGLDWLDWLIILDVVIAGIAIYLLYSGFRKRQSTKNGQEDAPVSENVIQ